MNSESRRRKRHNYEKNILCFHCQSSDSAITIKIPFLFEIVDVSYGGLGIYCKNSIPVNSVLSFRLTEDDHAREFNIIIRWMKHTGEGYHMGAEFKDVVKEDIVFLYDLISNL